MTLPDSGLLAIRGRANPWHGRQVLAFAVALVLLVTSNAWASLGDAESSIDTDRAHIHASRNISAGPHYSVHDLKSADGGRIREYVGRNGVVFAVTWNTQYKPDLSTLLGKSYPAYAQSAMEAAQRSGIKRQFRHDGLDLVVHSTSHLHVFSGYSFLRAMLPPGFSLDQLGSE